MEVQFTVNLVELKRAVRRLLVRWPDESEAGDAFIVFKTSGNRGWRNIGSFEGRRRAPGQGKCSVSCLSKHREKSRTHLINA